MGLRNQIIVVAATEGIRTRRAAWFTRDGYDVCLSATLSEAQQLLSLGPDLVVSALKLGAYNGLPLAAYTHGAGIPTLVIGPGDIALERDAEQLGAVYLSSVCEQDLLELATRELAG